MLAYNAATMLNFLGFQNAPGKPTIDVDQPMRRIQKSWPKKITFTVERADWRWGSRGDADDCAIARALNRYFATAVKANVAGRFIWLVAMYGGDVRYPYGTVRYYVPMRMIAYLLLFDLTRLGRLLPAKTFTIHAKRG